MTGKAFVDIICAVILGTVFLFSLVQGFLMHVTGDIRMAVLFYFVGLLFFAGAKICMFSAKCCSMNDKPVRKRR